jgi:hypothetical protein
VWIRSCRRDTQAGRLECLLSAWITFFWCLRNAVRLALNKLVKTTDRFAGERYNDSDYTFLILVWGDGNMAIYCKSPYRGSAQITRGGS